MKTYRIIIPTLVLAVWAGCTKKAPPPPSSPPPPPAPTVSFGSAGSWSPDQKRLVVSRGSRRGLEIVDSATGQRSPLVPNGKDSVWSPDGRYIAFVQEPSRDQYLAEEVWIIEPDGSNARRLARGGFPRWSVDGKSVFVHSRADNRILAVSVDDLNAAPEVVFEHTRSWYPAVSPDRSLIAFGSRGKLEIIDRATGSLVLSWDVPGERGMLPSWSPDGKYIAYGGFDGSQLGLWCLEVAVAKAVQLAEGPFTLPMWSKDGKRLAFDYRSGPIQEVWSASQDWVNARLKGEVPPLQREEGGAAETPATSRPR